MKENKNTNSFDLIVHCPTSICTKVLYFAKVKIAVYFNFLKNLKMIACCFQKCFRQIKLFLHEANQNVLRNSNFFGKSGENIHSNKNWKIGRTNSILFMTNYFIYSWRHLFYLISPSKSNSTSDSLCKTLWQK